MASTIAGQTASFALMLAIGFLCAHAGVVSRSSLPTAIALSTKVFLPAMLFSIICERMDSDLVCAQLPMAALAFVFYPAIVVVMKLLAAALHLEREKSAAFRMVFIFGNTGFIGLPILVAVFPDTGAANLVFFAIVDQLAFWTYGASLARAGVGAPGWKATAKGFFNPNIVAMALALACVGAGLPVPEAAVGFLGTVGAAATPLCMVCLGALCRLSNLRQVLRERELYVGVLVKMMALPLCAAPLLGMLPLASDVSASMVLMMGMPPTVLVPLVVEASGGDGPYATALSVAAVAFAVLTLPLVACFSDT